MIVAFDPGRNLGVAFVTEAGAMLEGEVLAPERLEAVTVPPGATVLVGDGTGSREVAARLRARGLEVELVPEAGTSLEARTLYFQQNEPRWWARLVPVGMRSPPVPIDHYAAYAIALRWLKSQQVGPNEGGERG